MLQRLRKNRLKHKDNETNIESPLDSVGVEERKSKKLQQRLFIHTYQIIFHTSMDMTN